MIRGLIFFLVFLGLAAVGLQRLANDRHQAGWRRLSGRAAEQAQNEGLQELLAARVTGLRVTIGDPQALDVIADLAFVSATLAHHYGLETVREAEGLLQQLEGHTLTDTAAAAAGASRALLALERGQLGMGEKLAREAAARDRNDIRPLLVQARARALAGDPVAASKLAEAAAVKDPAGVSPLLVWAEARLDLGQAAAALDALRDVQKRAQGHTRAQLRLIEARQTTEGAPTAATEGVLHQRQLTLLCRRDAAASPVLDADCAATAAATARLAGNRADARTQLATVSGLVFSEPRTLARSALMLAQLGQIDEAERLAARAARIADPRMPLLAWARVAIALGRGQVPARLPALRPAHPEIHLVAARTAFASRGQAGLKRLLAELGANALSADAELRAFSALAGSATTGAPTSGPVAAYVNGMRARLGGDLEGAARGLAQALTGHGDACRAAGEYLVVMRLLKRTVGTELDQLRAESRDCVNLTLPPPRPAPPRPRPRRAPRPTARRSRRCPGCRCPGRR